MCAGPGEQPKEIKQIERFIGNLSAFGPQAIAGQNGEPYAAAVLRC